MVRRPELVVVAARGGNAHQGCWLAGGYLVPECKPVITRTNWTLRNDLNIDCPTCLAAANA